MKKILTLALVLSAGTAFSQVKAVDELKALAPAGAAEAAAVAAVPASAPALRSAAASASAKEVPASDPQTVSRSGYDNEADAQADMKAVVQKLQDAGYTVLTSPTKVVAYQLQEYGSFTIGGSWGYQYQITYIGPEVSIVGDSGFGSEDDAAAAMKKTADQLSDYAVLSQHTRSYALPEYGSFTIGGSWAFGYSVVYIPRQAKKR